MGKTFKTIVPNKMQMVKREPVKPKAQPAPRYKVSPAQSQRDLWAILDTNLAAGRLVWDRWE